MSYTLYALSYMWAVWFFRNKHILEQEDLDALRVAASFVKLVNDYCLYAVMRRACLSPKVDFQLRLIHGASPPDMMLKANFDALINHNGEVGWV